MGWTHAGQGGCVWQGEQEEHDFPRCSKQLQKLARSTTKAESWQPSHRQQLLLPGGPMNVFTNVAGLAAVT